MKKITLFFAKAVFVSMLLVTNIYIVFAAAPTGTSATLQNTTSSTVDIVVTGTDFSTFVSSGTTTANATDRSKIVWRTLNPQAAVINSATQMTLTFTNSYGTDINGNTLTINADAVQAGDSTHNALISIGPGSITDNAAPVVFNGLGYYADANRDGTVDGLYITVSEPVTCSFESGDWSVATPGTVNVSAITGCSMYTSTAILLSVTTTPGITGGGTNPVVSYSNQGTLGSIKDSSNNQFASNASLSAGDAASPQIKTVTYQDLDNDGKIDTLILAYTETATAASVLRAADLVISSEGSFTGASIGSSTTDLITGSVTTTTITLATEATAYATGDAGAFRLSSQNSFSLTDGFNTNNTARVQSHVTNIDGASPIALSAQYMDQNQDGTVDQIVITTTSDNGLACGSVAGSDFTVNTPGTMSLTLSSLASCSSNGTTSFTLTPTTPGTASTTGGVNPVISFVSASNHLIDATGNNMRSFSSLSVTDGARPVLTQVASISSPTHERSPVYVFSATEDGVISYGGSCSSGTTSGTYGSNSVRFATLEYGTYSDCTISFTDGSGNTVSSPLHIPTFIVIRPGFVQIAHSIARAAYGTGLNFSFVQEIVSEPFVTLNLNADPATVQGVAISLKPDFSDTGIVSYAPTKTLALPNEPGVYTVYVKYYSLTGYPSDVVSRTVTYTPKSDIDKKNPQKKIGTFSRALRIGDNYEDVRSLQVFLNTHGYPIASSGIGSQGKENTYFGQLTKRALIKFQVAESIKPANGVLGPRTMEAINAYVR